MVWKLPITGETRTVTRFAFLPTRINNEVWWLELCTSLTTPSTVDGTTIGPNESRGESYVGYPI